MILLHIYRIYIHTFTITYIFGNGSKNSNSDNYNYEKNSKKRKSHLSHNLGLSYLNGIEYDKLNKTFLSYQCALESCMNVGGSNKYKLHHIQKDKNKSNGVKYDNVFCDPKTYSQAITQLEAIEHGRIS